MSTLAFTDSAAARAGEYGYYDDDAYDDRAQSCAIAEFAPYDAGQLRRTLARFLALSGGGGNSNGTAVLPALPEPGLYALAAALAHPDLAGVARPADLADALRSEIRCRSGQGMGSDPSGPVRRGRLLQHIRIFTALAVPGASPLQRRKMLGDCPFCRAAAVFQVSLPSVCWQCFACARRGGLVEFAECLLTDGATVLTAPTPAAAVGAGSDG